MPLLFMIAVAAAFYRTLLSICADAVNVNLRYMEERSSSPHSDVNLPGLCLQVTVELKNDLAINGTLHSVDQYLNIKLTNTRVVNEQKYPHMVCSSTQQHGLVLLWC